MGRFVNKATNVVFTVDDSKDDRYSGDGFEPAKAERQAASKRAAAKKSDSK